jgi:predicted histone-like DNA-binding protein
MLKYNIIKQRNTLGEGEEEIYYPRLAGRHNYGLDDVAKIISRRSSLSKSDIVAALAAFEEIIPELLTSGNSVKLGDLGTFSIQAGARSSTDKAQVSWHNFREINIRFKAGKALKLSLRDVQFRKNTKQ